MFAKLKYILFDFSDNFKNDFLDAFKKSVVFIVVGIIAGIVQAIADIEVAGAIAGGCIVIFGFIWGRSLVSSLAILGNISKNFIIRMYLILLIYVIAICVGYIYFIWCLIKMIVILIKKVLKN